MDVQTRIFDRRVKAGFSLITVLVGLAVLGISAVVISSSLLNLNKATNTLGTRSDLDMIHANVNNILGSNRSCFHSFRDDKAALLKLSGTYPQNIPYFGMGDTPPQALLNFIDNKPIALGGGLVIDSFQIMTDPIADGTVEDTATSGLVYNRLLADLRITAHTSAAGNFAAGERKIDILKLPLLVDQTTNEIIYCGFPFAAGNSLNATEDIIKGGRCPAGTFASAITKTGDVTCTPYTVQCPAKHYLQGLSPDGLPICQPVPEPPVWPAAPVVARTPCSSIDFKPGTCAVTIPADKTEIDTVSVDQRLSKSSCVLGKSYGVGPDKKSIYVKDGCRAEFGVLYK